jgi:sigma-E factor negative regulatory protein RseC
MKSPEARVIAFCEGDGPPRVLVEVFASFRCARCASGKGCGAGLLGDDGSPRRVEALLGDLPDLRAGDKVVLDLAPQDLLRASALVYGLPLGGAMVGAAVAWLLGAADDGVAMAALAGAVIGILVARLRLRRRDCLQRFMPVITARVS